MFSFRFAVLFLLACTATAKDPREPVNAPTYARVTIAGIGPERLTQLKQTHGLQWWVELDQELLVLCNEKILDRLSKTYEVQPIPVRVNESALIVVSASFAASANGREGTLLAQGGRFAVLQLYPGRDSSDVMIQEDGAPAHEGCHIFHTPFVPNTVLASDSRNQKVTTAKTVRTDIQNLVDAVDGQRWLADVSFLSQFDRISGSEDVDLAATWISSKLRSLPHLQVEMQDFPLRDFRATNVIATLEGTQNPEDIYIIGAHYDSISPGSIAPGAEDNGSGVAAVLEMARIFSAYRPHATILFICYSGEEQGLYGSFYHVNDIKSRGLAGSIKTAMIMDMIGYSADEDLDMLLETGTPGLATLDVWTQAAHDYTDLRIVTSTNPFGSDHVPYLNNNISSLLTIENDWDEYPGYHRSTDTIEKISLPMGVGSIKMNIAALAGLIGFEPNTPVGSVSVE